MTTIVANREKIVADSKVTDDRHDRHYMAPKIVEHKGDLIACAGDNDNIELFLKWYKSRRKRPKIKPGTDFDALVIRNGRLYVYDNAFACDEVRNEFWAIGSGAEAALGALHAGADLERAVEIACRVDNSSGLPIQVMKANEANNCGQSHD